MDTQQLLEVAQTIEILQPMFADDKNQWLPVIAAIGGAFVGSISTFFPNYLLEFRKSKRERQSVETALVSEVSALLDVIKHRGYIEDLESNVHFLEQNPKEKEIFSVKIPDHYSRIYQENISKIGLVRPDLSSKIIRFHQLIDAAVQDISVGGFIADTGGDLQAFNELLQLFRTAREVGLEIVKEQT